jgi:hypothetical protein
MLGLGEDDQTVFNRTGVTFSPKKASMPQDSLKEPLMQLLVWFISKPK